jgi:hypothetical protein
VRMTFWTTSLSSRRSVDHVVEVPAEAGPVLGQVAVAHAQQAAERAPLVVERPGPRRARMRRRTAGASPGIASHNGRVQPTRRPRARARGTRRPFGATLDGLGASRAGRARSAPPASGPA